MNRVEMFLERLYENKISNDYDRIIPVVGEEGDGKSTFMLEAMGRYQQIRDAPADPQKILSFVVFDSREAFKRHLVDADPQQPIALMDAAHVLHKKDTMTSEQKEVEKTLLDVRLENYLILLGYQDWSDVPDQLQRRRAKNAFHIPKRGVIHGYNRNSLDEFYNRERGADWPEPDLEDTFPDLAGTEIWEQFEQMDHENKLARMRVDDGDEEMSPQEVVNEILEVGVAEYVDKHKLNGQTFISKDLIRFDYPTLSEQQATQVKQALRREVDVEHIAEQKYQSPGGDPQVSEEETV